jgi:2-dehydropantoate 2-reductase
MRIAVVGCGALGSYYGACLWRQGHETFFVLRSDYEVVRRQGVRILSPNGDFTARPHAVLSAEEVGPVDLVVIGLKSTANHQFSTLLPPLVGPGTAVLTLQNGLGNEEALAALFPAEQILGGLCFVCLNRIRPGVVTHLAHGRISLGQHLRPPDDRTRRIAGVLVDAGIECAVADNLERARWEKLVWNIPFNGLGVAGCLGDLPSRTLDTAGVAPLGPCLSTDLLLGDPAWRSWVDGLMDEVRAVASVLGFPIAKGFADTLIERTREMGDYRPSTVVDFESGRSLELESLFAEPLRRARLAGVPTPHLESLTGVLSRLASREGRAGVGSLDQ